MLAHATRRGGNQLRPAVRALSAATGPGFDTIALHGGFSGDPATNARGVPIYRTAPFLFNNTEHAANLFALKELGNIYTRLMNPTTDILEKRVSLLEGGHELAGCAVASGTSANFYAIINMAQQGDNVVSAQNLYGGTMTMFADILPTFGITTRFVDSQDPNNFAAQIDENTRCIFVETCANPSLQVADLDAISKVAQAHGLPLVVDATFSTPYLTRPFEHGADVIVHSLTKWLGGHGTTLGGIVIDKGTFDWAAGKHPLFTQPDPSYHGLRWGIDLPPTLLPLAYKLRMLTGPLRNLGACISPDNSWAILQGIETLSLRMERHCENSLAVAKHLSTHPKVDWVRYPGLPSDPEYEKAMKYLSGRGGGMVVFGVKGGAEAGSKFIDNVKLLSHVANVGDCKSLAIHPATTTHSQLPADAQLKGGILPELIRLSIGIESVEDIIADIDQALDA